MASVKIVLRNKPNKAGLYPLALRIIQSRKATYIHLGQHIAIEDWDEAAQRVKGSHPSAKRLNNLLIKKLSEATDKSLELETASSQVSVKVIRQKIKPRAGSTFFPQAQAYLDQLQAAGNFNRYMADKDYLNRFKKFTGDLAFSDITESFLNRFKAWMAGTGTVGERTAMNNLAFIRSIFTIAIKDGTLDGKHFPFGKDKVHIRRPSSAKIGLSREEVAKLEAYAPENQLDRHVVNLWLFSYYNAGMRISDVLRLKWSDIHDGRLSYTMGKNLKAGSIKMHDKAVALLEAYRADKRNEHDYVFPELKEIPATSKKYEIQRWIFQKVSKINARLRKRVAEEAGISVRLNCHISRHTFAQLAADKISVRTLQQLYRHSNVATTMQYQSNFITKDADDAIGNVIGI